MRKNEGLMTIVVVAIVIFALTSVALSVGAAAEGNHLSVDGAWVLKETIKDPMVIAETGTRPTKMEIGPETPPSYTNYRAGIDDSSAYFSWSWVCSGVVQTYCTGQVHEKSTWTIPPSTLVPGQTMKTDLEASFTASQEVIQDHSSCNSSIGGHCIKFSITGFRGHPIGLVGPCVGGHWNELGKKSSETIEWSVPQGIPGDTLEIRICPFRGGMGRSENAIHFIYEYKEEAPTTPTPTPTPSPGPCRISLTPSPAHVMPGGSVEISGQALRPDGEPIVDALIDVSTGGLQGSGYISSSRTDSQGLFRFIYVAPRDVGGLTSVNLAVNVEGCPVSATVIVYFGPTPTPTETPWAGQVKGISDETRGELEKKSKTEERKDKLKDTDDPAGKAKGLGATEEDIPSDKKDDFNYVSAGGFSLPEASPRPLSKAEVHNKVLNGLKEEKWKEDYPTLSNAISKKGGGLFKTIVKAAWTIVKKGVNLGVDAIGYSFDMLGETAVQNTVNDHYDFYAEKRGDGNLHEEAMEELRKSNYFDWYADKWRKVYNKKDYDKVFKDIYEKYGEGKK